MGVPPYIYIIIYEIKKYNNIIKTDLPPVINVDDVVFCARMCNTASIRRGYRLISYCRKTCILNIMYNILLTYNIVLRDNVQTDTRRPLQFSGRIDRRAKYCLKIKQTDPPAQVANIIPAGRTRDTM